MFDDSFFYDLIQDKRVCIDCLRDPGLLKFLRDKVEPNHFQCSYCEQKGHTVEVEELQKFLLNFFPFADADAELPIAYLKHDGEGAMWHDNWDTLEKFLGSAVCDEFYQDILENLVDARYSKANWASLTPAEQRKYQWKEFQEIVQLEDGKFKLYSKPSREERNHDELDPSDFYQALVVFLCRSDSLSVLQAGSRIHRVQRSHLKKEELIFSRLTSPPAHKAETNRFSPLGVSMFYGAKDVETSCLEIKIEEGGKVTAGLFKSTRDLCLVDFTATKFPCGRFDYEWMENYHIAEFLKGFLEDIRKEVKGEGVQAEYVPTQAICEFFRKQGATKILQLNTHNPEPDAFLDLLDKTQRIDGFSFRSSKGTNRTSYVFFYDNITSAEILKLEDTSLIEFHLSPPPTFSLNSD